MKVIMKTFLLMAYPQLCRIIEYYEEQSRDIRITHRNQFYMLQRPISTLADSGIQGNV